MNKIERLFGLAVAIVLASILAPFASPWPDGLEKVAEDKGFLEKGGGEPILASPIPDYAWPKIENERLATSAAGVSGTLIVFGLSYGLASLIKRQSQ